MEGGAIAPGLGDRLRQAREAAGLSRWSVAVALRDRIERHWRATDATVGRWERGDPRGVGFDVIVAVAHVTGVSLVWLATGTAAEADVALAIEELHRDLARLEAGD